MLNHFLFFLAAILASAINSLAGGGGLITFPPVGARNSARGSRCDQFRGIGPCLPGRGVAYTARDRRGPPALDIVAPRSERARWPGWDAIAGLHERTQLHPFRAVTDPGRHGALRTRAEALPQEKKSLAIAA